MSTNHEIAFDVLVHLIDKVEDFPETLHGLGHEDLSLEDRTAVWNLLGKATIPKPGPPVDARVYKTIVSSRYPEKKIHGSLGHAKTAISYNHRGGKLYELIDGGWVLMHDVKRGTATADLPWNKK